MHICLQARAAPQDHLCEDLARAVNCEHPERRSVQRVQSPRHSDGSVLDVTEIDAASNNGVDNIRDPRDEVTRYTPAQVRKRVFIIDEVHMLSIGAFNALLKTLEEPPEHVLFILATTELGQGTCDHSGRAASGSDFRRIGARIRPPTAGCCAGEALR